MKNQEQGNKELVKAGKGYMAALNAEIHELMKEELEGLNVRFDRVKIPAGGGLLFEMPGEDPEQPDSVKEITGVILYHHAVNSYYRERYAGGNCPPDCGSIDGKIGQGSPGGDCHVCPLNQFGSGENGSKACRNKRRIYLLREGEVFPLLLTLPTGSVKVFTDYIAKRIVGRGRHSYDVVTRITLKKATNSTGIVFSQAVFAVDRELDAPEHEGMKLLAGRLKEASQRVAVEFDADDPM
ncbi:hypothetical protein [Anaeroselena agilis]|uniref:Uncharacterized protein n=1 Tax=Anaeroselena agilis TaxID=3063788 RepID=A0ABU3NU80_9FIRM|nr:hypothetical protein [Selenomonadales bacterium 4137-cl]